MGSERFEPRLDPYITFDYTKAEDAAAQMYGDRIRRFSPGAHAVDAAIYSMTARDLVAAERAGQRGLLYRLMYGLKQKEGGNSMNEADQRLAQELAEERIKAEVERKKELIRDFGPDTYADESVFTFQKQFTEPAGVKYTYAAIKVGGLWYTTGPRGSKFTWDEFVLWLVSGPVPTTVLRPMYP